MNKNEEIKILLANNYFEAAKLGCDMFQITDILENIRTMLKKSVDFKKIEDQLDIYLGENIDNEKEFGLIHQLREGIRQLKRNNYEKEILEIFQTDKNNGWLRWLEIFGYELSKINNDTCKFLLNLNIPVKRRKEYQFIKKHTPFIIEERWVEGQPLFEFFIENDQINDAVKADLNILCGQVQLYHLLNYEKTFERFTKAKSLQPGTSKVERIFGEYYVQKKEFEKARKHLQQALNLDKNDYENYIVLGNLYKAEGSYETASNWYTEGIRENPGKADLYNRLLLLNEHPSHYKNHSDEIEDLLDRIMKLDHDFKFTALNNAAFVYQKNGDYKNAVVYYKKAIQLYPERIQSHSNLGYVYLEMNELKKSEEAFLKSIELDNQAFDGYWGLVALYRKKQDWEGVIANLKISEKYRPQWLPYIYNDYGNAYEKLGNLGDAQKYYLMALELDPEKSLGLTALTDIAELDLKMDDGIALLEKIREIVGKSYEGNYHYRTGIIYYKNHRYNKAIQHFKSANQKDPKNPVKLEYLGLAYEKNGDFEKAETNYRKAIEESSDEKSKYYNRLAFFLTDQRRYNEAIELLHKAIELKPDSLYFENLGYAYEYSGNSTNAEISYLKALELASNKRDNYENRLGVFHYNQGNFEKSIKHYNNAIQIFPKPVYYENLGLSYEKSDQLKKAEENYRKALEISESDKDIYYNRLGFFLSAHGNYKKALDFLKKAIKLKPAPIYYENLGFAYENLKMLEKAEENYKKALEISENKDNFLNRLGIFYYHQKKYEKAIDYYKQAIKENEKAVYYENLGNLYNDMNEMQLFEETYLKAAELEPWEGKYYFQLGWNILHVYQNTKKAKMYLNKAITIFKKTPEIEPEELLSIQFLGAAYQQEGNLDKAEEIFKEAYKLDSNNEIICTFMGKVYLDKNDLEKSLEYYKKALDLNPQKVANIKNVGEILERMGETEEAIKLYIEGTKLDPVLYESVAKVYFNNKDHVNAEKYIRLAMNAYPDNYIYMENLGLALQNQGRYAEAREEFTRAMENAPPEKEDDYINFIGNCWFAQKSYKNAAECYEKARQLNPDRPVYFDNLIEALQMGDLMDKKKAIELLEENLIKDPTNKNSLNNLGSLFYLIGEEEKAINCFKSNIEFNPMDSLAYDNLGFVYENLKQPENALEMYTRGAQYDVSFYDKIGKVYLTKKDYAAAEKYIIKSLESAPNNDIYLTNLGIALANQNKLEEAETVYKKAVEIHPGKPEYYDYLAGIEEMLGKNQDAVAYLEKAIQSEKIYKDKYFYRLGELFQKIGDAEKAKENYESALRIYPGTIYFDKLGNLLLTTENFEKAAEVYLKALTSHPTDPVFLENFGKSCAGLKDKNKRKEYMETAKSICGMDTNKLTDAIQNVL